MPPRENSPNVQAEPDNFYLSRPRPKDLPRYWSAREIALAVQRGNVSPREIVADLLIQIKLKEPELKAWEYLNPQVALHNADRADRIGRNDWARLLAGVPVAVKDIFNTSDMPTTMGSDLWKGFTPGNDARVIYDVKRNGGCILGKTVTAEFAVHYLATEKTRNPHGWEFIPGTSSSGSAVVVASYMAPISLGTQTAGSIIRPASYCGVFGFKPTFGTIPRTGILKTADTLDSVGCFARSVDDLERCFEAIRVHGRNYPIVHEKLHPPASSAKLVAIRTGVLMEGLGVTEYFERYSRQALQEAVEKLSGADGRWGFESFERLPELDEVHNLHATIYNKALAYYFQQEARQFDKISDSMKILIEQGSRISVEAYIKALRRQAEVRESVTRKLENVDLIVTLSTAGEPPRLGVDEKPDTCLIWSFLGFPALTLPLFQGPNRMPFGLQLVAKRYEDYKLLSFARLILSQLGFDKRTEVP